MLVTDVKRIKNKGTPYEKEVTGFYMDGYLMENLDPIPQFLKKAWDCVGIVSGHGKVRIGKLLPTGSNILMSNGCWKKIEDIKIGDKVISPSVDGKKTEIVNVIDKVEHKQVKMCEIKSSKDNSPMYKCCVDHNVPVRTLWIKTDKTKSKKPTEYIWKDEIYQAGDLADKNEKWFKNHCPKIITSPVITQFETKDFEIDPYFLGLYLGDGWITSKNRINISNPDLNIFNWLKKNNKVIKKYKNNTIVIEYNSKKLVECGTRSYNKRIPRGALISSYEYRKKLLEGLIDTDSYINKSGFVVYTTTSERLALDIKELCKTLGCRVSINIIYKNCQTFKDKRKYYNVNINLGLLSRTLNLLRDRKKRLLNLDLDNIKNRESQFESININRIPETMDGYCIQVDGESHLYITDNFCVTHNSTIAAQVCFFIAWRLAGGQMAYDKNGQAYVSKHPKQEVKFNLAENVVFSAEDLQAAATRLYDKYGKNQVILYDEGRQGLDSARSMESINKGMEDFFQECGFMGHVIIIVLPSFFKLKEDYAVARSIFLIDAFATKEFERGYFNFYNERQKEYLYFFGKKKIGISAKYQSANESFFGRFTSWLPFDKDEYEKLKKLALEKKRKSRLEKNHALQRDACFYILNVDLGLPQHEVVERIEKLVGIKFSRELVKVGVERIRDLTGKSK